MVLIPLLIMAMTQPVAEMAVEAVAVQVEATLLQLVLGSALLHLQPVQLFLLLIILEL